MKSIEENAREKYSKLALEKANKTIVAGRYSSDAGKEEAIATDIIQKLATKTNQNVLDIGCGYGSVTELLLRHFMQLKASVTLMDLPEIIDAIKTDILGETSDIHFITGFFPNDYDKSNTTRYDRILLYSVLHYSSNPAILVEEAINLLKPNGILMLGDLPNISKKGRFLSSKLGREFEAQYKNTTIDKLPFYPAHHEFVTAMKNDPLYYSLIDDELINDIILRYNKKGYDVYRIPQPDQLPFCNTREDILIRKYD